MLLVLDDTEIHEAAVYTAQNNVVKIKDLCTRFLASIMFDSTTDKNNKFGVRGEIM